MSYHDVTDTPQALYPDGFQESVIISNDGPGTLYVDENASISSLSYGIPATGTIVWDAHRPLWVRSLTRSRIIITRNGQLQVNNAAVYRTLFSDAVWSVTGGNSIGTETDMIEVASYNTLHITFLDSITTQNVGDYMHVVVTWFDSDGTVITEDMYYGWRNAAIWAAKSGSPLTLPVKGHYCTIATQGYTSLGSRPYGLRVTGTSRQLRDSWDSMGGNAARESGEAGINHFSRGYYSDPTWDFSAVKFLNGIGNKLTVNIRYPGTTTSVGEVTIEAAAGSVRVGRIPIPNGIGSGQVTSQSFIVPSSWPLYLTGLKPTGIANVELSIVWEDYN